jgi:hypothetical protein
VIDATTGNVTRFAPKEMTPVDRVRAKELADHSALLAAFVAEACLTIDTLWDENARLQEGVDRQMGLVAELRGQLGIAEARAKAAGTFGMLGGLTLTSDVVDAFRTAAQFARDHRYLAVSLDIEHVEALVVVLDKIGAALNPPDMEKDA